MAISRATPKLQQLWLHGNVLRRLPAAVADLLVITFSAQGAPVAQGQAEVRALRDALLKAGPGDPVDALYVCDPANAWFLQDPTFQWKGLELPGYSEACFCDFRS
eukprot:Skav236625  [mRNA]  locus=scaffold182:54934:63554:+ [translate_table: standard]